jgi:hypothetical protein
MPSNRMTSTRTLYYQQGERVRREFSEASRDLLAVRFTRIAGKPSSSPGIAQRGEPVIELVFTDHLERLRHRFVRHSPDGFEWGYGGSGPAEAALNILAFFIGVKNATDGGLYQAFKFHYIANISQEDGGELRALDIRSWVESQWRSNEER